MNCRSGKESFATPQQAWHKVMSLLSKGGNSSRKRHSMKYAPGRLNGYRCPMCKLWHVGHTVIGE